MAFTYLDERLLYLGKKIEFAELTFKKERS